MRQSVFVALLTLWTPFLLGKGDGSFQSPLSILNVGRPGAVTVHAGDLNKDGKLDLVVANGVASNEATGTSSILVLLQSPSNRLNWTQFPLRVGTSSVFVRTGDMDGDGIDDILVADTATTAYYVRSKGDGTFDKPVSITQARGSRWLAVADFDNDGKLDLATANFNSNPPGITVLHNEFLADGTPKFTVSQTLPGSREHTMEALDFDGDGNMDLMLGSGLPGITPFKGSGNGKFVTKATQNLFSCVEYITIGQLNNDGKDDLSTTCIDDGNAFAGVSLGNATFKRTLGPIPAASGTESTAIADLNGDGKGDVALVSNGSTNLWVHVGKGDGTFLPPVTFAPTGADPVFLIAEDLDRDGHNDVISADQISSTVTIFWGKSGERFMESGYTVTGFSAAKAMAIADFDRDTIPDLLFPSSSSPRVQVYLKPGGTAPTKPSFAIDITSKLTSMEAVDLDGDGIVDLAGSSQTDGTAVVVFFDAAGKVRSQGALPAGVLAGPIAVGKVDAGDVLDLVVPAAGSNWVTVFLGQGGGTFADPKNVPSIEKPRDIALGDLDGDGNTDLAVIAPNVVAIHYGKGGGDLAEPVVLVTDATKNFTDEAIGDVTSDGIQDLVVTEQKTVSAIIYKGKGNREFADPQPLKVNPTPIMVVLSDLNEDGFLDITTANGTSQSISIILGRGPDGFADPVGYRVGFAPLGHRIVDIDKDGALDLVAYSGANAIILLGRPQVVAGGHFLRGDASGDGVVDITDPVRLINNLFLSGDPLPCEDAGDANDDGLINVSDPISLINRLFLASDPLPGPGPVICGTDDSPDQLRDCTTNC